MAVSVSGVLTLFCITFAGPLLWGVVSVAQRIKKDDESDRQPAQVIGNPDAELWLGVVSCGTDRPQQVMPPHPIDRHVEVHRDEVSSTEYLLQMLGYAIGLGNLWRFPYLVGKWGGGAFVFAYVACIFFVAIPAYLLEMVFGQCMRQNTVGCFKTIHLRWLGLAYGQALMLFLILSYYNVLISYACIYIIGSLSTPLPWDEDSSRYFHDHVLNSYGDDYDGRSLGAIQGKIALALLSVWVIVFFSMAFGKHFLAKVTWVTVVGPAALLCVLLLRTTTLDGARDGLVFYLGKFDVDKLRDVDMWAAACGQILFSLSPAMGTAITVSSYTKPSEDVYKAC